TECAGDHRGRARDFPAGGTGGRGMVERLSDRITFQEEKATDTLFEELKPLLEVHWKEIAHYPDIPLNPRWDIYRTLGEIGALRGYTFRDAGTLVGYAVFIVTRNIHYGDSLQAVQDVIWLTPALRHQLLGARFIQWCDEQLAAEGVQVVR